MSGAASTTSLIGGERGVLKGLRTLTRQRPEHEGKPVDADHVRLDPEHENGDERGSEPRLDAALTAVLVLGIQTDVIGVHWLAFVLWTLAGERA